MRLHNIMEEKVIDVINHLMSEKEDFCTCERCKLDAIALALNEIQPKYVVTNKGELFGRIDLMTSQYDADIVKEVTKAIEVVKKSPRHE